MEHLRQILRVLDHCFAEHGNHVCIKPLHLAIRAWALEARAYFRNPQHFANL